MFQYIPKSKTAFTKFVSSTFQTAPKSFINLIEFDKAYYGYGFSKGEKTTYKHIHIVENKKIENYFITADGEIHASNIDGSKQLTLDIVQKKLTSAMSNDPDVHHWNYSDSYLFDKGINLTTFKEDQTISLPLQHFFYMYGAKNKSDITDLINEIMENEEAKSEFQSRLSSILTKEFKEKWPEHDISIKVITDGPVIKVHIEDDKVEHKFYRMPQRSDGFKRFMSIIIYFSLLNDSNLLEDKIIIIDEPETHLHPSGIRLLRDELLKIAQNNIVLLATHSPYMIDHDNIDRHFIVEKNKDSHTTIDQIKDYTSVTDDEVLRRSFGINIFSDMFPGKNILVEGDDDKIIIQYILSLNNIIDVQVIPIDGASKAKLATSLLDGSRIIAIFDGDEDGRKGKNSLGRKTAKRSAFILNDISKDYPSDCTIEDLYPSQSVIDFFSSNQGTDFQLDTSKPVIAQLCSQDKTLAGKANKPKLKRLKYQLAEHVIESLRNSNIADFSPRLNALAEWLYHQVK